MTSIRQIEIFAKLADLANMSDAAQALGLTQPALSHQLRKLEARIGLSLFDRVPSGMELTPTGRELLSSAQNVLSAMRDFDDATDRAARRFAGSIRFGVTPTLGPYLMPSVIKTLHARYPDLRLFIREGIPAIQLTELVAGKLDMVLSPLPVTGRNLHVEPLFREVLHVVAPPDDPLVEVPAPDKEDFAGRTFLTLDRRHHYHWQLERICTAFGSEILSDYEGTSLDALQQMVGSGVGLAVLPELYVRSGAGGLDVVRIVEPAGWSEYRSVGLAWRQSAAFADLYAQIGAIIAEEARCKMTLPTSD